VKVKVKNVRLHARPARRSPLAEWIEELSREPSSRRPKPGPPRACVLAAMAMAAAEAGGRATAAKCAKWMPPGEAPAAWREIRAFGGKPGAARAVRGGLAFPGGLGGWSPGFLAGLEDAGAVRRMGLGMMEVRATAPEWLRSAFAVRQPFAFHAWRREGVTRVSGCFLAMWRESDGFTRERAAGALAGSRETESGGRKWMSVPAECGPLLSWAGVRFASGPSGSTVLLVSPFFVSLFAAVAPGEAAGWMGRRRDPAGMCPEVAGAFWEMCFPERGDPRRTMPRGGLPYLLRGDGMRWLGWGKRRLRALARELWPVGVHRWVRGMGAWWAAKAGIGAIGS
jgi:hypothetical protein